MKKVFLKKHLPGFTPTCGVNSARVGYLTIIYKNVLGMCTNVGLLEKYQERVSLGDT